MSTLTVFSESAHDDFVYENLAERITGRSFELCDVPLGYRKHSGVEKVLAMIRMLLRTMPKTGESSDRALIIAVDNDRCPGHPGAVPHQRPLPPGERDRSSRWELIQAALRERWGENRAVWPMDVAVAVPVEMLESWVLLLLDPHRGSLPIYPNASDMQARIYHHPEKPGPQLKDLAQAEARQRNLSKQDLLIAAASDGDLEAVEKVSPSFQMFAEDLRAWRS
jgi:hypothetical protein